MKKMKEELRNSGMSEEEILMKTSVLMKCFKREDPTASMAEYALANRQKNSAMKMNGTSPKDFTLVSKRISAIPIAQLPWEHKQPTFCRPFW